MDIFLIDDDEEECELLLAAFSLVSKDVKVKCFTDPKQGIEELSHELPDYLFLDLNMPRISGKDVLKLIRNNPNWAALRIIIYSTSISQRDIDDTKPYGVMHYLKKADNLDAFSKHLKKLLSV